MLAKVQVFFNVSMFTSLLRICNARTTILQPLYKLHKMQIIIDFRVQISIFFLFPCILDSNALHEFKDTHISVRYLYVRYSHKANSSYQNDV